MRNNYDFSKGVRDKYAEHFREGINLVLLDPDVSKAFPSDKAINNALRKLMEQRHEQAPKKPSSKGLALRSS